jgi:hypothetical protein
MSDLKRLLEEGSPFERSLLLSSESEGPSRSLEDKILATIATTPAIAHAAERSSVHRSPARRPAGRWVRPIALATVAVGLLIGGAAIELGSGHAPTTKPAIEAPDRGGTLEGTQPPAEANTPPAARVEPQREVPTVSLDSLPTAPRLPPSTSLQGPPRAPVATAVPTSLGAPSDDASSIEREIALLDTVKARLVAGAAADAARMLDTYDTEFPNGTLRPEATVLRIRTLLIQGRRSEAQRLADEFLAKHPSSVHAKRIRVLLAE